MLRVRLIEHDGCVVRLQSGETLYGGLRYLLKWCLRLVRVRRGEHAAARPDLGCFSARLGSSRLLSEKVSKPLLGLSDDALRCVLAYAAGAAGRLAQKYTALHVGRKREVKNLKEGKILRVASAERTRPALLLQHLPGDFC